MKKAASPHILLAALCALLVFAAAPAWCVEITAPPKHSVLLLNSYHNGYSWSDNILDGVRDALHDEKAHVDLHIEYLDGKRARTPLVHERYRELLRSKYADQNFEVIVATDNLAVRLALSWRDSLFPGVPIVFCGVNDVEREALIGENVTGVLENVDIVETLRLAKRFHPWAKRVVVVGDSSITGLAIRNQVISASKELGDIFSFDYITSSSLDPILNGIKELPPDAILYLIPSYYKVKGSVYDASEVLEIVSQATDRPVYSNWNFLLGHGSVGGKLISGHTQGYEAGKYVAELLRGVPISSLPIIEKTENQYIFSYPRLMQFHIPQDLLPPDSIIVDAPKAFYEVSKDLFWSLLVSFVLLTFALVMLAINILRRRRIERKIINQLSFQEILMDSIPQLVCWKDLDGRYLGANRSFTEFFGIQGPDYVMGKTDYHIMKEGRFTEWVAALDREVLLSEKPRFRVRISLSGPGGETLWLEMNKVPLYDANNKVVGTLSTAENMTREINLERQLLQSQKMEAIGALAGGIAHDFNNILTSIMNSAELALMDVEPDTDAGKDLERVIRAASRGKRLVQQIMAFSRPSQEGFQPTDLAEHVRDTVNLLQPSLPRNITVNATVTAEPACVMVDPTQIYQVLMNLCTNAFQAMRNTGGELDVRLEDVELDMDHARELDMEPGRALRLVVADTGPGIAPEILDKVFDPFFTTKGKKEGTGLGLSVVLGIVKNHAGAVRVKSRPDEGATFEIYLPARPALNDRCELKGRWPELSHARILFVEDDPDQLLTTPRVLESLGFEVTPVAAGSQALDILSANPAFDLVITDFDMPGVDGVELAKRIGRYLPQLPVILISGRNQAKKKAKNTPNIRRIVDKPFGRDELAEAVSYTLGTHE
ncbi:ABC transporter substrate binding protein [Oceanidesulfovibrio marinus]|uniref:histidine kinase n=1 Tax=Oceanidesulfovibrio marinus TaxID=370038 RepID=A0A6P1ZJX1_9BACT|nr:ABC transporter substrate binding protein [Oceanidesulfovibrio marinus]TVM33647.1 hybrid sensor histidine kinase/response regulator [Oceanidesulfovibrio marinus]